MPEFHVTRVDCVSLVFQAVVVAQLTGDDLRTMASLVDADRDVEAERGAAFERFRSLVDDLMRTGSSLDSWTAGLDAADYARLVDDAELAIGLRIDPRPPTTEVT